MKQFPNAKIICDACRTEIADRADHVVVRFPNKWWEDYHAACFKQIVKVM